MNKIYVLFLSIFLITKIECVLDEESVISENDSGRSKKLSDSIINVNADEIRKTAEVSRLRRKQNEGKTSHARNVASRKRETNRSALSLHLEGKSSNHLTRRNVSKRGNVKSSSLRAVKDPELSAAASQISSFVTKNLNLSSSSSSLELGGTADLSDSDHASSIKKERTVERPRLLDSAQKIEEQRAEKFKINGMKIIGEVKKYLPPEQAQFIDEIVADLSSKVDAKIIDLKAAAEGEKQELEKITNVITDKFMRKKVSFYRLEDLFTRDNVKELVTVATEDFGKDYNKNLEDSVKERVMKLGKKSIIKLAKKLGIKVIKKSLKPAQVIKMILFVTSIVVVSLLIKHHFKGL